MSEERRTQADRSREARDQVVQAALTVFALKGYSAASMDDICMAAGSSKGGLYHHFSTKSAVLAAVVERLAQSGALLPPFESALPGMSLPSSAIGRILIEVWTEAAHDADLRGRLRAGYEASLDAQLRGSGQQPTRLAEILRIGTLIQLLTRGEQIDAGAVARKLGIERAA